MSNEEKILKSIPCRPYEDYYMDCDLETGEPYPVGIAYFCPSCLNLLDENENKCTCGQLIDWSMFL